MKATFFQRGETIDYTNGGSSQIDAGSVISLATRIGVAAGDIAAGAVGAVHTIGVFVFDKASGEAMTVGQVVYFDESEDEVTGAAVGNVPAGWVIEAAGSSDTEVKICIADIDTAPEAAVVAAVSAADAAAAAGTAPTKAEYDVAVALANANKAALNAVIAALKTAGLMATS